MTVSVDVGDHFEPIATLDLTVPLEGGFFRSGSIAVTFPPDSLSNPVNVQVSLYTDPKLMPVVDKSRDEYIVSPLLVLEPHGLTFKKAVQIRFPIPVNPEGWHLSLQRAMCEISAVPQTWEPIVTYDTQTNHLEVTDCDYNLETGTLSASHFCRHYWLGRAYNRWKASKNIHFSVFGCRPNRSMNVWNLVIHCHDKCNEIYEVTQ